MIATVGVLVAEGIVSSQARAQSAQLVGRMPGSELPEGESANWILQNFASGQELICGS